MHNVSKFHVNNVWLKWKQKQIPRVNCVKSVANGNRNICHLYIVFFNAQSMCKFCLIYIHDDKLCLDKILFFISQLLRVRISLLTQLTSLGLFIRNIRLYILHPFNQLIHIEIWSVDWQHPKRLLLWLKRDNLWICLESPTEFKSPNSNNKFNIKKVSI